MGAVVAEGLARWALEVEPEKMHSGRRVGVLGNTALRRLDLDDDERLLPRQVHHAVAAAEATNRVMKRMSKSVGAVLYGREGPIAELAGEQNLSVASFDGNALPLKVR